MKKRRQEAAADQYPEMMLKCQGFSSIEHFEKICIGLDEKDTFRGKQIHKKSFFAWHSALTRPFNNELSNAYFHIVIQPTVHQ
jgi:hypothetical protein